MLKNSLKKLFNESLLIEILFEFWRMYLCLTSNYINLYRYILPLSLLQYHGLCYYISGYLSSLHPLHN